MALCGLRVVLLVDLAVGWARATAAQRLIGTAGRLAGVAMGVRRLDLAAAGNDGGAKSAIYECLVALCDYNPSTLQMDVRHARNISTKTETIQPFTLYTCMTLAQTLCSLQDHLDK